MTDDTFTILRSGFDTLEIAYRCAIPEAFLFAVGEAKQKAELSRKEEPLSYLGETFLVGASGASGGYAYVINTGPTKAIWCFRSKVASPSDPWRARVKIRSYCLALKGLIAAKNECDQFLITIGAVFDSNDARVSRADYAVDVYCPQFKAIPENFVVSARTTKTEIIERSSTGDRCNYLRIGKLPGKQLCVYDKGSKIKLDNDLIWKAIFEKAFATSGIPYCKAGQLNGVWRFELRTGSKYLTQALGIRRWDKFISDHKSALLSIIRAISLRVPSADTNRARWLPDVRWNALESHIIRQLSTEPFGELPAEIRKLLKDEFLTGIYAQIAGCLLTTAAAENVCQDKLGAFVGQVSLRSLETLLHNENLATELSKRRQRVNWHLGASAA
tara:strand:- start:3688 stop:4848 length:1161 start_codon:yes stop_codon:yes gene_type:complete